MFDSNTHTDGSFGHFEEAHEDRLPETIGTRRISLRAPGSRLLITTALLPARPRVNGDTDVPSGRIASALKHADLDRLSDHYAHTRDQATRDFLVIQHQGLVRAIAGRFNGMGEPIEDLIQVGNIGLINAVDRYDPAHGTRFSTYAIHTIYGEIRRYFRDKSAGFKVPRLIHDLRYAIRRATEQLAARQEHPPTNAEIARHLRVTEEQVATAVASGQANNLLSLDAPFDRQPNVNATSLIDLVGKIDHAITEFETNGDLHNALQSLDTRERDLLHLRFFDELSQAKIAAHLGLSQMHISRLLHRTLKQLREMLTEDIHAANHPPPPTKPIKRQRKPRTKT